MSQIPLPWHLTEMCIDAAYPLTGARVTIALIDTGVDATHPALAGRIVAAYECSPTGLVPIDHTLDHDFSGHGTRMAGLICADRTNGGVAPRARIISLVYPQTAGGYQGLYFALVGLARALTDGVFDVDLVNLSSGLRQIDPVRRQLIHDLIRRLLEEQDVLVVTAVGNQAPLASLPPTCPADHPDTLAVGASGLNHHVCETSRNGPDLVAPGEQLLTCQRGGTFTTSTGTSPATAIVTGIAALYLDLAKTPADVLRQRLFTHCDRLVGDLPERQGRGLIQVP